MRKLLLLSFTLFFAFLQDVEAQSKTVSGRVTAVASGDALPGVTVLAKGTTVGTATSADGAYTINVPDGANTLVFRFIGYETVERAIGNTNTINVSLAIDDKKLEEVVIVGYSTTTQQSFTGTAKVVSGEKLESKSVSNVSQALAGEVAGVRVINTSGQPGTEATIRIRGIGSVNGNRAPLYVVDGVPFSGSLNSINPADIESTTVLKDAAATAIYGSRGANGVVVITTKSGRGKKSYIEADANFGTNMALLPRYSTIKSPEQYIGLSWEALYNYADANPKITTNPVDYANANLFSNAGIRPGYNLWNVADGGELIDPETRTVRPGVTRKYDPENWEDYGFQNSARQEVNVKFGGSSDKTSYYSSFGYLNDKGYIINSDYERISARLNVRQEVNSWLTGGINFNYARSETNNNGQSSNSGSIFWFVDNIPSIYPLFMRDAEGGFITDPIFGGNQYDYGTVTARGFGGLTNAIADATYDTNRNNRNELNGSASLDFNIAKGLTFENRIGAQYYHNKYVDRGNKYYGGSASQNGSLFLRRTELFNYNLLNLVRYSKDFGQHNVEALAAHEATNWKRNILDASGYSLVDPLLEDLNNAIVKNPSASYTDEYSLESYFGQINYDFDKKYFLSTTLRRDGSSRFRKDKWGTFGSVGAAWLVTNEDFMDNLPIFNSLKLKASYGLIGDQAGVGFYPGYDLFNVDNLNDAPAFSFDVKGNPDLTWETSKMFQTGIEFGIGNHITGSVDYYQKNTEDLIFERRVGPSLGYALLQVNDGNLKNQGVEFDLTGDVFKAKDYRLSLNVNGEIFSNEITKMPIDPATGQPKTIDVQAPYAWSEGHSIYDFYVREWAGVDPQDGLGMWTVHYDDANGNGSFDSGEQVTNLADYESKNPGATLLTSTTKNYAQATQKYIGKSALPDVRGAFNLSAGYKGFDLSAQLLYSFGGYAYDYTYAGLMSNDVVGGNNWHTDIFNRWQKEGDITDVPRLSNEYDANVASTSSRFITKANYLVLNNVRLSYTVPTSFVSKYGIGGLSVWVTGDNLWINTARDGFNPSTAEAGSSSTYRYSPLSTVTAGLRIKI
ncbi:SusC/RagA family TonB-linked outer membrane protein [Pontibacter oryzae]|uniref:SusC/RagA family TonB-linked outer membrane protein n=1 Tax=Pontibacter oryzae TaxID=2304593 RepID=A0A399S280_9BACT|nr:SusC/RagA family TonB-linked outer membrane protein [Pontibacter oryzae]RIJ36703.1 SusC/RagA family TonB-linked outer membrane protein [Pontibacter oryzae]